MRVRVLWVAVLGLLLGAALVVVGLVGTPAESVAAATWFTAATAIVAAVVGLRQLRETVSTRREQTRPHVTMDLVPDETNEKVMYLVATSSGQTSAYDVRFTVEPPFETSGDDHGYPLMGVGWLARGIPSMPPGRSYRALYGVGPELAKDERLLREHLVTIDYCDHLGHHYTTPQRVDGSLHLNALYVGRKSVHHVAEELVKIRKALTAVVDSIDAIGESHEEPST